MKSYFIGMLLTYFIHCFIEWDIVSVDDIANLTDWQRIGMLLMYGLISSIVALLIGLLKLDCGGKSK